MLDWLKPAHLPLNASGAAAGQRRPAAAHLAALLAPAAAAAAAAAAWLLRHRRWQQQQQQGGLPALHAPGGLAGPAAAAAEATTWLRGGGGVPARTAQLVGLTRRARLGALLTDVLVQQHGGISLDLLPLEGQHLAVAHSAGHSRPPSSGGRPPSSRPASSSSNSRRSGGLGSLGDSGRDAPGSDSASSFAWEAEAEAEPVAGEAASLLAADRCHHWMPTKGAPQAPPPSAAAAPDASGWRWGLSTASLRLPHTQLEARTCCRRRSSLRFGCQLLSSNTQLFLLPACLFANPAPASLPACCLHSPSANLPLLLCPPHPPQPCPPYPPHACPTYTQPTPQYPTPPLPAPTPNRPQFAVDGRNEPLLLGEGRQAVVYRANLLGTGPVAVKASGGARGRGRLGAVLGGCCLPAHHRHLLPVPPTLPSPPPRPPSFRWRRRPLHAAQCLYLSAPFRPSS